MSLALLVLSIGLAAAIFALTVGWLVLERRGAERPAETETADSDPDTRGQS